MFLNKASMQLLKRGSTLNSLSSLRASVCLSQMQSSAGNSMLTKPAMKLMSTDNRAGGADEASHDDFQPKSKGSSSSEVTEHISQWITENDVCVFMKGTRKMP